MKSTNLSFHVAVKESNKLSNRQKQRVKKRLLKKQHLKDNAKELLKKKLMWMRNKYRQKMYVFNLYG